jgi:hypothetical protein
LVKNAPAGAPVPAYYFDDAGVARLRDLVALDDASDRRQIVVDRDYADPVGKDPQAESYGRRWLAAFRPVVVSERAEGPRDTGWVVIVQEPYDAAVLPAQELGHTLVRYGLTALGVVIAVVTVLWGIVMIVLNESPRLGLTAFLRRRAGIQQTGTAAAGGAPGSPGEPPTPSTEHARRTE